MEELDISSTDVVDIEPIFHLKSLKKLILPSELSKEKIDRLKKSLPNCEIDVVEDERDTHFPSHTPRKPE